MIELIHKLVYILEFKNNSVNHLLSYYGFYSLRIMFFSNLLADARWIISKPVASIQCDEEIHDLFVFC